MSATLAVVCGKHERPVSLGESVSMLVRDGDHDARTEQVFGNAVTQTSRAVRWTCPKCGRSLSRTWPNWRAGCDALRDAGETRVDIALLRP